MTPTADEPQPVFDPARIRFALHGGAGDLGADPGPQPEQRAALERIAREALAALQGGASALDAVTLAVTRLEECPLFNAGVGAVLNRDGEPELDAAIMRGADRGCGAVTCVRRVRSPVQLARAVMERTPHVLFSATGAEAVARSLGLEMVEPDYFVIPLRRQQLEAAKRAGTVTLDHDADFEESDGMAPGRALDDAAFGTVGAVARDGHGHLAAATSTGGLTNKLPGRIGDTPIVGIGTFADDASCAVSCTGTGESFIRAGFALAIHAQLTLAGRTLEQACALALEEVRRYQGRGGCIAIGRDGALALPYNSNAMYRAWVADDAQVRVAIQTA